MRRLLALLFCALGASGALAQARQEKCTALADAARVRAIRVTSAVPQDNVASQTLPKIRTQVQAPPGYSGGGLAAAIIGAAIADAIINTQVQKAMERASLALPQLVDTLKDFDLRAHFWRRLSQSLREESRFAVRELRTLDSERTYLEEQDSVDGAPIDAALELRTSYFLSADLRAFFMETEVLLQARPDGAELYRCRYRFSTPPVAMGEYEAAVQLWAADEGALFRAAALIGIEQTLLMLRYDLMGEDAPRPGMEDNREIIQHAVPAPGVTVRAPVSGKVVARQDSVVLVREESGAMRAAWQGETFAPSRERMEAVSPSAPRRAGPVGLDDLLGVLEEAAPPARAAGAAPGTEKAPPPPEPQPARGTTIDDLGGLLRD